MGKAAGLGLADDWGSWLRQLSRVEAFVTRENVTEEKLTADYCALGCSGEMNPIISLPSLRRWLLRFTCPCVTRSRDCKIVPGCRNGAHKQITTQKNCHLFIWELIRGNKKSTQQCAPRTRAQSVKIHTRTHKRMESIVRNRIKLRDVWLERRVSLLNL